MNKAIFLDKDGTLVPDIPYNIDPQKINIHADAIKGLKQLYDEGYLLIIISNQSGIARGYFSEVDFMPVVDKINALMKDLNIKLTAFYYCPHHPDGIADGYNTECECRKPRPGLLQRAAAQYDIDLNSSWMIGDILNDVEAGNRAGCRSILVDKGYETEWIGGTHRLPSFACRSIDEAAQHIHEQQLVNEDLERL